MYMKESIVQWNQIHSYGMEINNDTLLFAGDQVHLSSSEDCLQRGLRTLYNTTKQFGMKIPPLKSKGMTFQGQVPVRSETVINESVLLQVNTFTHFECNISYEEDITSKIRKFLQILGHLTIVDMEITQNNICSCLLPSAFHFLFSIHAFLLRIPNPLLLLLLLDLHLQTCIILRYKLERRD